MKPYISQQMQAFLEAGPNEEAVDQPLYHIQAYGTAGATTFTFFNTAVGSATNGLSDTNMDASAVLSAGKRFAIFSIGVAYIPGQNPVLNNASTTTNFALNDAKGVLEGTANLQLKVLDKVYLIEAPLLRVPAGIGLFTGAGGIQRTQASAADGTSVVNYGTNGMPFLGAARKLRVPVPIPQQVRFEVTINYPTAVTVVTAGRIGCWLDGVLIRARQ
jgi:hypothetical protein